MTAQTARSDDCELIAAAWDQSSAALVIVEVCEPYLIRLSNNAATQLFGKVPAQVGKLMSDHAYGSHFGPDGLIQKWIAEPHPISMTVGRTLDAVNAGGEIVPVQIGVDPIYRDGELQYALLRFKREDSAFREVKNDLAAARLEAEAMRAQQAAQLSAKRVDHQRTLTLFAMSGMILVSLAPLIAAIWMSATDQTDQLADIAGRFGMLTLTGFTGMLTYFHGKQVGTATKGTKE